MICSYAYGDESSNIGADAVTRRRGLPRGYSSMPESSMEVLIDDSLAGVVAGTSKRSTAQAIMLGIGTAVGTHMVIRLVDKLFFGDKT